MAFPWNHKAKRQIKENWRIQAKKQHSEPRWSSGILMALAIAAICIEMNCQAAMEAGLQGFSLLDELSFNRVRYHWKS